MERLYYLSHWLWRRHVPLLPRLLMILTRVLFQSYIPYTAVIGPNVHFAHRMGIMIHREAKIGANVRIFHFASIFRCTIEDDVSIYPGAKIVRDVHVGRGASIGANSVVIRDVPANTTVMGVPARPTGRRRCAQDVDGDGDEAPDTPHEWLNIQPASLQ